LEGKGKKKEKRDKILLSCGERDGKKGNILLNS